MPVFPVFPVYPHCIFASIYTHDGSMVLVENANMNGIYWWDPWSTIYSRTMDPMGYKILCPPAIKHGNMAWKTHRNIVRWHVQNWNVEFGDFPAMFDFCPVCHVCSLQNLCDVWLPDSNHQWYHRFHHIPIKNWYRNDMKWLCSHHSP